MPGGAGEVSYDEIASRQLLDDAASQVDSGRVGSAIVLDNYADGR
jgi:hypothetical protein